MLDLVSATTGERWTLSRLIEAIDLGQHDNDDPSRRVFVLDPVDGTKGFIRREHYCIALGLLVPTEGGEGHKEAQLSVLGCPNLCLRGVLQEGARDVSRLLPDLHLPSPGSKGRPVCLPPSSVGAVFFAVSGQGAFARGLEMPRGQAFEVFVSSDDPAHLSDARICESFEASHGNRLLTRRIAGRLGIQSDYIHVDGMCKQALVGAGAAEATLRLPPATYLEKIWDHVAGTHFVEEAGGVVSDLEGRRLDFSHGRTLSPQVRGVVSSNGPRTQQALLQTIREAQEQSR